MSRYYSPEAYSDPHQMRSALPIKWLLVGLKNTRVYLEPLRLQLRYLHCIVLRPMPNEPLTVGLIAVTGLLTYRLYRYSRERKLGLPPGPRSYPLIGHLLSVPKGLEHIGFMRLGEQIGSKIFSLSVLGTTIIVLNDKDDAANLFDKRSAIYSDRTCPPMVEDPSLLDWGDVGTCVGFGDRWRKYRRLMNPWLTKQAVITYHGSQEQTTRKLLKQLLKSSNKIMCSHELYAELYLSVSATLFRSLYGYEAESSNDPILSRTQKLIAYLANALLASSYLVNKIPALRYIPAWFPGAGWKRDASKWRKEKELLIDDLYNIGLENMKKDEGSRLMITSLRSQTLRLGLTGEEADDYVKQVLIVLVGGGTDTTVNTVLMFFSAMVLYPEVQKKAQEELDSVIGNTRLPTIEDRDRLKYVEMIMQETFRWAPVAPLAIPHTCFQDDTYKGYYIPKGAIVIGNVWAMTRDSTVYSDPETFNPDRYSDPSTPPSPLFGWGRRRCPGIHFGEASVFIVIASILMSFNIEVTQDENGKDVLPSGEVVDSLILTPQKFMLKLTPRSPTHEELIQHGC
ncbi:hypothetical protein ACGC1H_003061 [Rhizoctonia solani]|uniref:O-methylsterigmatocystin oxidoreductase n=1 Tax=Rhizoctonia solani TaxID=456999 RepID=A0A8H3GXN2_9AGAM|nr:unnamed protein product [Rhizoctonia solani]